MYLGDPLQSINQSLFVFGMWIINKFVVFCYFQTNLEFLRHYSNSSLYLFNRISQS